MIKSVPFNPTHCVALKSVYSEPEFYSFLFSEENIETLYKSGPALTVYDERGIIGCGGILLLHPGVGQAWMVSTWRILRHKISVVKLINSYLRTAINAYNLSRVQAYVLAESKQNLRLARFLGFEEEGTMRKFMLGKDFKMMAIVK